MIMKFCGVVKGFVALSHQRVFMIMKVQVWPIWALTIEPIMAAVRVW
jgi:hypothetical protein